MDMLFIMIFVGWCFFLINFMKRNNWVSSQLTLLNRQCFLYSLDQLITEKKKTFIWKELGVWSYTKILWSFGNNDIASMTKKPEWTRLVLNYKPSPETIEAIKAVDDVKEFVNSIMEGIKKDAIH